MTNPADPNSANKPGQIERDVTLSELYTAAWDRLDVALNGHDEHMLAEAFVILQRVADTDPATEQEFNIYFGARRTLALESVWTSLTANQEPTDDDIQDAQLKSASILSDHPVDMTGKAPDQAGLMDTMLMVIAMRGYGLVLTDSPRRQTTDTFGIELQGGVYIRLHGLLDLKGYKFVPGVLAISVGKLLEDALRTLPMPPGMKDVGSHGNRWRFYIESTRQALTEEAESGRLHPRYSEFLNRSTERLFQLIEERTPAPRG